MVITLAALVFLLAAGAWFAAATHLRPAPTEEADGHAFIRTYNRIGALAIASDVVVVGDVTSIVSRQPDTGASGDARLIPSTWYEIEVRETLKGETGSEITVVRTDPGFFDDVQVTALSQGESVLLFLSKRTSEEFPMVTVTNVFYIPVSFDNGVFDVLPCTSEITKETDVRPRVPGLFFEDPFSLGYVRKMVNDSAGLTLEEYDARGTSMVDYFGNHPFPIDRCEK